MNVTKHSQKKIALYLHMRTHTGERPHKCSKCDKALKDPSTLKKHMRLHNGKKTYQCTLCDKCFS